MSASREIALPHTPVAYAQLLLELAADRGLAPARLLRASRLPAHALRDADARISATQWGRLVWQALQQGGDEGLGYAYGLRLRPTAHGALGFALLCAPDLGAAFRLLARCFSMRVYHFQVQLEVSGDSACLRLCEGVATYAARRLQSAALRRFYFESLLLGFGHAAGVAVGRPLQDLALAVDWPEPAYHTRYRADLPPVSFGAGACALHFAACELATPLLLADPVAWQLSLRAVEDEFARFGRVGGNVLAEVRQALRLRPGQGFPALEEVAAGLHLSPRTLKRRLQERGTGYGELLRQEQQREACALLAVHDEVQEVAALLGFSSPATFTRAFRTWTGVSPSEFRALRAGT